ncbi:histidine kinase [Actinomadura sp. 3N407]|uniref:GAF domain-containing sensor histidine kinase n=1 Tax=Actinomadura sp. 3N407 TaxID=3457423 RepID=UPI003FCE7989
MLEVSADGMAVLDRHARFTLVNPTAEHILGISSRELLGASAPFDVGVPGHLCHTPWTAPDGRQRDLEYRLAPVPGNGYAVWFRDVTETLRQRARLTAIVRAASSVADAGSLRATLDAVAREIVMTANIAAVQILAIDDPNDAVRVLGMAGFGDARDFTERLSACRRRGARVRFLDAFQRGEPVVVPHRKPMIMADPVWEPLWEIMDRPDWDGFVAMPMVIRGRTLGAINAYYVPREDPGADSLAFLKAMADHAAVAIDTAALLAQARSRERRRLARDLHDSVVQQLFSMRMQAKALRAQLDGAGADPAVVRNGAEELAELSQSALNDLRGLVFELRPLDLGERGLVEAVQAHASGLEARTGLAVDVLTGGGGEPDLGVELQEDLYRIVQEALHNVVKHARAAKAVVRFDRTAGGGLDIEVTDDGRGPGAETADPEASALGLVSMRERAERWGGLLTAGPRAAGGWTVRVRLPGTRAGREGDR